MFEKYTEKARRVIFWRVTGKLSGSSTSSAFASWADWEDKNLTTRFFPEPAPASMISAKRSKAAPGAIEGIHICRPALLGGKQAVLNFAHESERFSQTHRSISFGLAPGGKVSPPDPERARARL
jgi:hypothetical protein